MKRILIWLAALAAGALLGWFNIGWLNDIFDFIATVYTRLFQFVAVPTIALAVVTTLASMSEKGRTGRIFLHTLSFTLLTTLCAALLGLLLFEVIAPQPFSLASDVRLTEDSVAAQTLTYRDHLLSVVPNNIITPFASGNVLSILLVAFAVGLAIAHQLRKGNEQVALVYKFIVGAQDLLYTIIHALILVLPLGIVAFAAQLSAQISAGVILGSLGRYVAVILGGNLIQFFGVLPLFLLLHRVNPLRVLRAMSPAVLMALFTKSSAATLPVTMRSAEENLRVRPEVARFVLPICTTINMNGCAAFILVTSLFVMQNAGVALTLPVLALWVVIAILSAVGNAGVPMGCYFLTLSLMSGVEGGAAVMGLILPLFTIIDMVETAENVWSDSCVCALVDKRTKE